MSTPSERQALWVVDRFEGDLAVVDRGDGRMLDLPRWLLPPGAAEGDWLAVTAGDDGGARVVRVRIDPTATRRARADAEQRLLRLKTADPGGDVEL